MSKENYYDIPQEYIDVIDKRERLSPLQQLHFQTIGVTKAMLSSEDIKNSIGLGWEHASYSDLEDIEDPIVHSTLALSHQLIAKSFDYLHDSNNPHLIEWGVGEARLHPISEIPADTQIIAVEPQEDAVLLAARKGKLDPDFLTLVTDKQPPYRSIPTGSADGVLSIASFHILDAAQMQSVFAEFHRVLLPRARVLHIQDINPNVYYLYGMSDTDVLKMEQHITDKTGLSLEMGNLLSQDNFWTAYAKWNRQNVLDTISNADENISSKVTTDLQFLPELINRMIRWRSITSAQSYGTTEAEIMNFINKEDGLTGIKRVMSVTERLGRMLAGTRGISIDAVYDKETSKASIALTAALASLKQDMFEGFLSTSFKNAGFRVSSERVVQYQPDSTKYLTYSIDGSIVGYPVGEGKAGQLYSVRAFNATKIPTR